MAMAKVSKQTFDFYDVHAVVNDIAKQAIGASAINVVDTASFMDLGNAVLSSSDAVESFMDTLLLRLAKTYYTTRPYNARLRNMIVSGSQWAAIYQKLDGDVQDFVEDATFSLEEGKSVDMYVVRKPTASQKLFVKKVDYTNYITWTRKLLQGAFTDESAFQTFVSNLNIKMQTKLDFATENLARLAIGSYIANMGDAQKVHLLTEYKAASGQTLTKAKAYLDKEFLAWAAGRIELACKRIGDLSVSYNKEGVTRHTPSSDIRFIVYDEFATAMQYCLQYQAFHDELVRLREYSEVSYWQAEKDRDTLNLTVEEDGKSSEVKVQNIVGFACDRYAVGCFRSNEEVATTPYNARGRYYNTFYHNDSMWYNDLSENGVLFLMD